MCYHDILQNFQRASSLQINSSESVIYHSEINQEELDWLINLFGFEVQSISGGIKYLGYRFKSNGYSKSDWLWLTEIFQEDFNMGEQKPLSGRESCFGPIGFKPAGGLLGAPVFSTSKHHSIYEQNHHQLHLGWPGREKKVSLLEAFTYIYSEIYGWLGSVSPEILWKSAPL